MKKKKINKVLLWSIIAVVAVAAIVIGAVLILDRPQKPYDDSTPEGTAQRFLEAYYTRDYVTRFSMTYHNSRQAWEDQTVKVQGSAEAFFALVQQQADERGIEAEIHSFDDYYACYYRFIQEDIQRMYGNHTLTVQVTESKKMEPDNLAKRKADALNAIDAKYIDAAGLDTVTEGYTVNLTIRIDGDKKTFSEHYYVHVINHNGQWKVIDHTI